MLDKFLHVLELKEVSRTGWEEVGIDGESVADHSYGTALLCLLLAPDDLDQEKLLKMALLHDLGEVKTDDVVIDRGGEIDRNLRRVTRKIEQEEMQQILSGFGRESLLELWNEYAEQSSEEAKFLKQVDKLEAALQAYKYREERGEFEEEDFTNWLDSAEKYVEDEDLKGILESIPDSVES